MGKLLMSAVKFFVPVALGLGAVSVQAQQKTAAVDSRLKTPVAAAPQLQPPSPEVQVMMIRSSLIALNQANQTNNYSVLSGLAGPSFRTANSPQKLSQAFEAFRSNNIDLAPIALIPPRASQNPVVNAGALRLQGFFPSAPMQVNYDLSFEPVGGQWKLLNLAVNLQKLQQQPAPAQTAPAAPGAPPQKK